MDAVGNIVGGVVIGWLLAQLADIWKRRRDRTADAAYLGATVLIELERLIHGCASVAGDEGTAEGHPAGRTKDGEDYYLEQTQAPALTWEAVKVEWKSIDPNLMYSILSLPLEIDEAKQYLADLHDYDGFPYDTYIAQRQLRFAEIGVMVVELAGKLRLATGVPRRPEKEWNPDAFLIERLQALRQRQQKVAAANKMPKLDLPVRERPVEES
jgi:hypothetical protein